LANTRLFLQPANKTGPNRASDGAAFHECRIPIQLPAIHFDARAITGSKADFQIRRQAGAWRNKNLAVSMNFNWQIGVWQTSRPARGFRPVSRTRDPSRGAVRRCSRFRAGSRRVPQAHEDRSPKKSAA
jgi:hypothetical protein